MEEGLLSNLNIKDVFKRRLPIGLAVLASLLLITIGAALGLPSIYQSRAVILIEQQEIPQDLVRSMVTSFADQRIQVISQRVLTTANLRSIIEKYDLYAKERKRTPLETVIEHMRDDVAVTPVSADVVDPRQGRPVQATIAFDLSYENERPEIAQRVVNELVSLFLNENLRQRQETSTQTVSFLTAEGEKLGKQIAELEGRLAKFKEKNQGQLPELQNINIEIRTRAESDIRQIDSQITSLEQQRVYLESELAQQQPNTLMFTSNGERLLGPVDRLKVLQTEFAQVSSRYGINHPDVVAKRKEIEGLQAQVGSDSAATELATRLQQARTDLAQTQKKYSADYPDVKRLVRQVATLNEQFDKANAITPTKKINAEPDNPAYIQLKARLEAADSDLRSYRVQRAELSAKIANMEDRLTKAPEVEREYRTLTRDYEGAQAKYQDVASKRQEAELSSNLELEKQGERFTLIEPPVVPEKPAKPNRVAIGLLGSFLAFAGSVGASVMTETLDQRIYGRNAVMRLLGVPPLAIIPEMDSTSSRKRRKRNWLIVFAAVLMLLTVGVVILHLFYKPLDVLYYLILRKMGI